MKKQIFASSKNLQLIFSVLLFLVMMGCSEEKLTTEESISVKGSKDEIIPLDFNWEGTNPNDNWMPMPPELNASNGNYPIPSIWNGASDIDPELRADCKKSEGWELVYNTFTKDLIHYTKNPYYILYNKYRGIIRVYRYVNSITGVANSTYIQHGIELRNNKYSLLNFDGAEVIDVTRRTSNIDKVSAKVSFAPDKWYVFEYEIAYDPQIKPTLDPQPPQFWMYVKGINIDSVKLSGTQEGTLRGTIGSSSSSQTNIFSTIGNTLLKPLGTGALSIIGGNFIDKHSTLKIPFIANNDLGLSNDQWTAMKTGVNDALKTATNSIPGSITNILSGIFGGSSSSSVQPVNLNIATNIRLKGSIASEFSFPSSGTPNYIPGYVQQKPDKSYNVTNWAPAYPYSLGLFNLSNTPTINSTYTLQNVGNGNYFHVYEYGVNENSYSIQWNPALLEVATIQNLTKEVIVKNIWADYTYLYYRTSCRDEKIQGGRAWAGTNISMMFLQPWLYPPASLSDQEVLLRISFVVRPKNGAPPVAIVKTFKANNNRIYREY